MVLLYLNVGDVYGLCIVLVVMVSVVFVIVVD